MECETTTEKEPVVTKADEIGPFHTLSSNSEENPEELAVEEPSLNVSMEDVLDVLCDKEDSNDDEKCYNFQREMFMLHSFGNID